MRVIISTKTSITTGEKIMDNVFDEADNLISLLTDNIDMPGTDGVQSADILSAVDYYDRPEISASDLKLLYLSVKHWIMLRKAAPTPAMDFGRAFHTLMLEPHLFDDSVKLKSSPRAKIQDKEKGVAYITADEMGILEQMRSSLNESHTATSLLYNEHTQYEKEIYFDYVDIQCRAKIDAVDVVNHNIIDLKTISTAENPYILKAQINKYAYDLQMAFYILGASKVYNIPPDLWNCYIIFIEKTPPFGIRTTKLSANYLNSGMIKIGIAMDRYREYLHSSKITAYEDTIIELDNNLDYIIDADV